MLNNQSDRRDSDADLKRINSTLRIGDPLGDELGGRGTQGPCPSPRRIYPPLIARTVERGARAVAARVHTACARQACLRPEYGHFEVALHFAVDAHPDTRRCWLPATMAAAFN